MDHVEDCAALTQTHRDGTQSSCGGLPPTKFIIFKGGPSNLTNETSPMAPSEQEPHSTQPQQSTPDTVPQDAQQAAQPAIPQSTPEPNPQNVLSLLPANPAGLIPASSAKDGELIVLTANGPKSLTTCVDEAYNGPNNGRYLWTHIGISNLYADIFSRMVRYVADRKLWFAFNGKCWTEDRGRAMELCKLFVVAVKEYTSRFLPFLTKKQQRYIENLTDRIPRETILKDASSVTSIVVEMSDFDKDPMLFNCQNGTFDLRTGILHEHNPDDMITKMSNVTYDPLARCARWEQHIDEVMEGDAPRAKYLQKMCGLCLTGVNPYECLFILHGATSRNGKGTTMETFMTMMGDYGTPTMPSTIEQMQKANSGGHTEHIARLDGVRVVNVSDPEKKLVINNSLVKSITGRDTIIARDIYEKSRKIRSGFKFVINTNYLPDITDPTMFTSGRIKVIPFTHHFDDEHQDKSLKDTLVQPQNLPGIFNWCYEGKKGLDAQGFDPPASVIEATAQYQQDSDKIAKFVAECLTRAPGINTKTEDVYTAYLGWCNTAGCHPENQSKFKKALEPYVKVGRSRSVGSTKLANAVSCVFDYSLQTQSSTDDGPVVPLADAEFNTACAPYGIRCISDPNINNRVDASMYVMPSPINNRDS